MNARFAHVLSRLSFVSVVAVSSLGAAACNRAPATDTADARPAAAQVSAPSERAPGYRFFRRVEGLGLTDDQRASMAVIERDLAADLAPHRATMRGIVATLADGIESGKLDAAAVATHEQELSAVVADARATLTAAMNDVHDTLHADQRAALVTQLRTEKWEHKGEHAREGGPAARLALQLGLSEEQRQALRDAVRQGVEEMVPGQRARREASEARMKALGDAFVRDDFDAADFAIGTGAEDAVAVFSEASARAVAISGEVLSDGQRQALAGLIRARAEHD